MSAVGADDLVRPDLKECIEAPDIAALLASALDARRRSVRWNRKARHVSLSCSFNQHSR
jgi:hypothetical protein